MCFSLFHLFLSLDYCLHYNSNTSVWLEAVITKIKACKSKRVAIETTCKGFKTGNKVIRDSVFFWKHCQWHNETAKHKIKFFLNDQIQVQKQCEWHMAQKKCDYGLTSCCSPIPMQRSYVSSEPLAIPCRMIRSCVVIHVYNLWFEQIHIQEHCYIASDARRIDFPCRPHNSLMWPDMNHKRTIDFF